MTTIFIPSFVDLPADVLPYIFQYLDIHDLISFASTCQMFRRMCVDAKVFRKTDLSTHAISIAQRGEKMKFFKDRQLTQHIRELIVSNHRVLNWQMDDQLEEFISVCLHLERLHVVRCGMSLQRLLSILKQAPNLKALSWSLMDLTPEDFQFIVKSMESDEQINLKNIKHLRLEVLVSKSHIQIVEYLLHCCFQDLEELEIYTWWMDEAYYAGCLPFPVDQSIPGFPEPSFKNELQHLHSLMMVAVGDPLSEMDYDTYTEVLSDFVLSVVRRKSSSTKWKKLWISPLIGITRRHLTDLSILLHQDDFQSVEGITAYAGWSIHAEDEVKTLFEKIGDNTVRSLQLWLPRSGNLISEFCDHISRVGGHSLKFLSLSVALLDEIHAEINVVIHSLFSNCLNIVELDLLYCSFEKDICELLSELRHLKKVQLSQCAISSKYNRNQVQISRGNLFPFVENCKNITHLDVRGRCGYHENCSCRLTDDDLLALAKLRNLKSLTLDEISGIREWNFLKNISKHCKFLTTLRISHKRHFKSFHIPILMESAKFLKHLAISVDVLVLEMEDFWNLLSHAKDLERLCIKCGDVGLFDVPLAVETLKSLPRLHVLHLHFDCIGNVDDFYYQMKRMLEEKESVCRFSFEIVVGDRKNTWFNHETGYSLKTLPLNEVELCDMTPILDIPKF